MKTDENKKINKKIETKGMEKKLENSNSVNSRSKYFFAVFLAILAAAMYGASAPIAKILLRELSPTMMAGLVYFGAGIGMSLIILGKKIHKEVNKNESIEANLSKDQMKYIVGMILLDIAAPILLMIGLMNTTSSNASLLNNFEIVATSLIALFIFKEAIGKRLWTAIFWITLASIILSFEDMTSLHFSIGSLFVLVACICWGLENNCTRMLSLKDPCQIVLLKGLGSGIGSLSIAFFRNEMGGSLKFIIFALILGFFSYGISIVFYIMAQRELGAARTSAYYAVAPFIGVGLSMIIFNEVITISFIVAVVIMLIGTYYAAIEIHDHEHIHEELTHEHRHNHHDKHHNHSHDESGEGEHNHIHTHEKLVHSHKHTPDLHHAHDH